MIREMWESAQTLYRLGKQIVDLIGGGSASLHGVSVTTALLV